MKKMVLFPLVAGIIVVGASTAFALSNRSTPINAKNTANHTVKSDASMQTSTTQATPDTQTAPAPVKQAQTAQPADTTPAPPTPDQNKVQIMGVITDYASSKGWSANSTYAETSCFDHVFTGQNLYANYDSLINFPMVQKYLAGTFMFNGTTCQQEYFPSQTAQ